MKNSFRCAVISLIIILFSVPVIANPFTGTGGASGIGKQETLQVAPVRTNTADQNLVAAQATLREKLGTYFYSWKQSGSASLLWGILGAAFLYGFLHAFGPGHRKTILFSLYLAREAPAWEPAGTGLLLSALHSGAAVILLLMLRGVTGAISGKADNIARYMEGSTYMLLISIALFLIVQALRDLLYKPENQQRKKMSLGTILLTGIYPCPGAILILILSLTLSITGIGILAVIAMSLGMSIPIIAAGYLAWFGRTGLFLSLKKNEKMIGRISAVIELFSYTFLLLFSLYMAEPFLLSLFRIIKSFLA